MAPREGSAPLPCRSQNHSGRTSPACAARRMLIWCAPSAPTGSSTTRAMTSLRTANAYDLLLDNVGNRTLSAMRRVLTPSGKCVMAGAPKTLSGALSRIFKAFAWSPFLRQKFTFFIAKMKKDDLIDPLRTYQGRKTQPRSIDRRYPLAETAAAIAYVEEGHARAKVVITFQ
jgi:NADPH:quinone reductase-like Zn-dependent oxidoreductase